MALRQAEGEAPSGGIKGWHVLVAMLAFFGVVFAVNGVFLVMALDSHTGIVSQQPYRKGLDYNDRIAADARQKNLGWTQTIELDRDRGVVRLTLKDRQGSPVTGLAVTGFVGRPSTEQYDTPVSFVEKPTLGTYSAAVGSLSPGNWLVQVEARRARTSDDAPAYRLRKRLWLKP